MVASELASRKKISGKKSIIVSSTVLLLSFNFAGTRAWGDSFWISEKGYFAGNDGVLDDISKNAYAGTYGSYALGQGSVVEKSDMDGRVDKGQSSLAIGTQSRVQKNSRYSIALGRLATVKANSVAALAIGQEAEASGDGAIAMGTLSKTSTERAVAIGSHSSVLSSAFGGVALGHQSFVGNSAASALALGNGAKVGGVCIF